MHIATITVRYAWDKGYYCTYVNSELAAVHGFQHALYDIQRSFPEMRGLLNLKHRLRCHGASRYLGCLFGHPCQQNPTETPHVAMLYLGPSSWHHLSGSTMPHCATSDQMLGIGSMMLAICTKEKLTETLRSRVNVATSEANAEPWTGALAGGLRSTRNPEVKLCVCLGPRYP